MSYDPGKVISASNGTRVVNRNVKLGGSLTEDTAINGSGNKHEILGLSNHKVTASSEVAFEANTLRLKIPSAANGKWLRYSDADGSIIGDDIPEGHPAVAMTFDDSQPSSFNASTQVANINPNGLKGVSSVDLNGSNELVITLQDGSTVTHSLATLAVDKFLANATWDAVNRRIVLEVNDGEGGTLAPIYVPLADLLPVVSDDDTVVGDGTTADPLKAGKLVDLGSGVYRWTAADGVSTFDITLPTFAGAENGVEQRPNGNVALGGSVIRDTVIDGTTKNFGFVEFNTFEIESGTTTLKGQTAIRLQTPNVLNSAGLDNGWALVLVDKDLGTVEYRRPIQTSKTVSISGGAGNVSVTADTGYAYVNTTNGAANIDLPHGGSTRITITFIKTSLDASAITLFAPAGSTVAGQGSFVFGDYDMSASGLGQHASFSATWDPAIEKWFMI